MKFYTHVIDIDECSEGIDGCAQICTDMDGNYTCSCDPGYRLASDNHGCDGKPPSTAVSRIKLESIRYLYMHTDIIDIDECRENLDGCDHMCSNRPGSYICSCRTGYRLAMDNHTCNGKLAFNGYKSKDFFSYAQYIYRYR